MARALLAPVARAFALVAVTCAGSDSAAEGEAGGFGVNAGRTLAHAVAQIWCADGGCQG